MPRFFIGDAVMKYWLMKSEPSEVSIDHLAAMPQKTVPWYGVRNYQARNFMMNEMQPGDGVLFYHSSCAVPGIAGLAEVASSAYPDQTQFELGGHYHDPKASRAKPRWFNVDVRLVRKTRLVPLSELRAHGELAGLRILQRGNRLSITPVTEAEWRFITDQLIRTGA
jgi:predicted RNA-binding protein with PUA-like domain